MTGTEQGVSSFLSGYGRARSTVQGSPLTTDELQKTDAYWRACKYLALGMIYLQDNPLLKTPLKPGHIKNRLLGHWGGEPCGDPGLAFIYIHLNRLIKKLNLDMSYMAGPGNGAPGVLAPVYFEGIYSEVCPEKSEDERGMREYFKQFSFPGGIGSHCTPETPRSIYEGDESGYVLSHLASVTRIYNYHKEFDYRTQVMGASFRNVSQVVRLAGSDLLTISPDLLEKLAHTEGTVDRQLNPAKAKSSAGDRLHLDKRPSDGCTTKMRWRRRSWLKESESSTATLASSKSTRSRKWPRRSVEA